MRISAHGRKSAWLSVTNDAPGSRIEAEQVAMTSYPFRISKEQYRSFHKLGYVCLQSFLPLELVYELREISDALSSQATSILESCRATGLSAADRAKAEPSELIVVPEADSPTQVCRYEFMLGSDLRFKEFVGHYIEPVMAELVGESVSPFKDKTNEKLPGGGAFRPHQDFAAYRVFKPRYHATAALTIHPADATNGCIQCATNFEDLIAERRFVADRISGRALLRHHQGGPYNGDIRADIAAQLKWHCLEVNAVDLIVFDSFVPHYSEVNGSDRPRRTIFLTYNRASEGSYYDEYYADKRANYYDPKFHVSTPTRHCDTPRTPIGRQSQN